jgi:hypothetical protein
LKNRLSFDYHENLGGGVAENIAAKAARKSGVKLVEPARTWDSNACPELQAHDFVAGALGSKYNDGDSKNFEIIEPQTKVKVRNMRNRK